MKVELLLEIESSNIKHIMDCVNEINLIIDNTEFLVSDIRYTIDNNLVNIFGIINDYIVPKNLKVVNSIYLLTETEDTHLDFTYTLLTLKIDEIILYC